MAENSDSAEGTEPDSDSVETLRGKVTTSNCVAVTRSNVHITPAEVATHVYKGIKIERMHRRAIQEELRDIGNIPVGLWCPATSRKKPVGLTYVLNKTSDDPNNKSRLESETPNSRLLQAYMQIRTPRYYSSALPLIALNDTYVFSLHPNSNFLNDPNLIVSNLPQPQFQFF